MCACACVFICAAPASAGATLTRCHRLTHFLPLHLGFFGRPGRPGAPQPRQHHNNITTTTTDKQSPTASYRSLGLNLGERWRRQVRAGVGHDWFWWPMGLPANWLMSGSASAETLHGTVWVFHSKWFGRVKTLREVKHLSCKCSCFHAVIIVIPG